MNLRDNHLGLLIATVLSLSTISCFGQSSETIRTARPGQAVGPFTTGQYVFQIQSGYTYGNFEDMDQSGNNGEFTNMLRFGLLENFEIRSTLRVRSDRIENSDGQTSEFGGISFWNVGIRYNILDSDGTYKPSLGFQTDLKLTAVNKAYRADKVAPRLMLIHGQKISDVFSLTTNWGVSWNGNDNQPTGSYVINISFPLTSKISGFIENYGQIASGNFENRWDTGLGYLLNNDFQLDISGGYGKNDQLKDWFIDAGLSWRVKVK